MGWLIALSGIVLLVFIVRKSFDRQTTRNFNYLGKIVVILFGLIVIWGLLSYVSS